MGFEPIGLESKLIELKSKHIGLVQKALIGISPRKSISRPWGMTVTPWILTAAATAAFGFEANATFARIPDLAAVLAMALAIWKSFPMSAPNPDTSNTTISGAEFSTSGENASAISRNFACALSSAV
jgi:hypothetical protein